jgi:hypothetical protein
VPPWPKCLRRRSPGQGCVVLGAWLLSGAPNCGAGEFAATVACGAALIAAQPPIVAATEAEVIKSLALATPAAHRLEVREIANVLTPADRAIAIRAITKQRWLSNAEAALRSNTRTGVSVETARMFVWLKDSWES